MLVSQSHEEILEQASWQKEEQMQNPEGDETIEIQLRNRSQDAELWGEEIRCILSR